MCVVVTFSRNAYAQKDSISFCPRLKKGVAHGTSQRPGQQAFAKVGKCSFALQRPTLAVTRRRWKPLSDAQAVSHRAHVFGVLEHATRTRASIAC